MSSALKSKLFLFGLSLIVLVLIPLWKTNFYAPVKMIRWRELTWDDFQGLAKPFTGWGAGINSSIYIEHEPAQNRYTSYAAMNNQISWTQESSTDSEDLLKHEQYHFNLTEYYARKLNEWIGVGKVKAEDEVRAELDRLREELDHQQDQYDTETDHGLNYSIQSRWEFRIDSLLSTFTADSGYVTDYYSGCRAFMPFRVDLEKGIDDGRLNSYRVFSADKYDMLFAMSSRQYFERMPTNLTGWLVNLYREDSVEIRSMNIDSAVYSFNAWVEAYDSIVDETILHRWVHTGDYLFKLTARYWGESDPQYQSIANSFLKSFQIIDNGPYWKKEFRWSREVIAMHNARMLETGEEKKPCLIRANADPVGFYGKPIFQPDGSVLIPYSVTQHADSLVRELVVINKGNNKQYSYELLDQSFLFLPGKDLGKKSFKIDMGYTTSEQVNGCLIFFNQSLEIKY